MHTKSVCTYATQGKKFIKQQLFNCITCNIIFPSQCLCVACAQSCHRGHMFVFYVDWETMNLLPNLSVGWLIVFSHKECVRGSVIVR